MNLIAKKGNSKYFEGANMDKNEMFRLMPWYADYCYVDNDTDVTIETIKLQEFAPVADFKISWQPIKLKKLCQTMTVYEAYIEHKDQYELIHDITLPLE